ncbi:tether containing UBX domain for GLUT4 [Achroia grisella]|uniref:tether containing UBX domain for GLUT4 n=1 Tax=Achroia grisella TaxID=688607 RepID=UPI0027D26A38|nr:tether containing UBX domain for GLUT4 [Achroia grisella]
MAKDITVLAPNGRRQVVHCTPDTSILQVLEDVCVKQGFQPTCYDLKHHNRILDLTTTVRFSNLPNKATLEMVEAERRRLESNVTISLLLEDGERRTADFPPNTSLYDVVTSLSPNEFSSLQYPTILYMRQEVVGETGLRDKTLRQLGLISGRAILRLLNKAEEGRQANVSTIYRRPLPEKSHKEQNKEIITTNELQNNDEFSDPGPSDVYKNVDYAKFDPIKHIRDEKSKTEEVKCEQSTQDTSEIKEMKLNVDNKSHDNNTGGTSNTSIVSQENLERRLKIEEEVTFLGAQKAIAFMLPDVIEDEPEDLPNDFYDLTIEEVRKLYHDLQQHRLELENTPLITANKRQEDVKQTSQQKLLAYKNVVVRVQFPDRIILQGVFTPTDTIENVTNFIKSYLQTPDKPFHVFTTPLKETLDPKSTLFDAKFVPCVHMHFKWLDDHNGQPYLKEEIYLKSTNSDAASILASKYRAPSRRNLDMSSDSTQIPKKDQPSTSKLSKVPKWFK